MKKKFVLFCHDIGQYYQGPYYESFTYIWTRDIELAKMFDCENDIDIFMSSKYEEYYDRSEQSYIHSKLDSVKLIEVKTVYINE